MSSGTLTRRNLVQTGLLATAAVSFGPGFWREALAASSAQPGAGPYGPLLAADTNGIQLPAGFSSRVIARAGQPVVPGGAYVYPAAPDASAVFATPDGGWILVNNSELPVGGGGVSAIRFSSAGAITDAYRVLGGTSLNCAGGPTPWGTWLSCEEIDDGFTWECDPTGVTPAVKRAALGKFKHEAACVDPTEQFVYQTEDVATGGFYRFRPTSYPDLSSGILEVACDGGGGAVIWKPVPDPQGGAANPTRLQVPGMLAFARGEGMWFDAGVVYIATTSDETIHAYETATQRLTTLYKAADAPGTPLRGVDNVHVSRSGDVFVGEDSYTGDPDAMDVCMITTEGEVARFCKLTGNQHFVGGGQSETVGIAFDPSGTRMYLGSQRGFGTGVLYEVSGPFRTVRLPRTLPGGGTATPTPTPTPSATPTPAPSTGGNPAGGGPAPLPKPGAPIGIDVAKSILLSLLTRDGLPVAFTLDTPATVKATLKANLPATKGKRRLTALASTTVQAKRGRQSLRLRPASKALRRTLSSRRSALTATLEIRVTAPGVPENVLKRTVKLVPAPKPRKKG